MRITIIGGGPAGLQLAILLRRDDPSCEVTVVERNPAGATYGWGVVFSEDTLGELRDADLETWLAIDDALVRWDALEVRHRGRQLTASGFGFSAIERRRLLRVLQDRAASLGAELRFETEVTGPEAFPDADLVVAADGVNSGTRRARSRRFGTETLVHPTRFAWFGTDLPLQRFTFIFEETPHGLFTVHAYPFDERLSTFIVEVGPETFRRAGLDTMDEAASLAFCRDVFADHLGGHDLLSNRSVWLEFVTVRNRTWRDGRVVLAGDAAHTAHFTIGSGTKLAMEDSIALAASLRAHPDDLDRALTRYEAERQPPVERFQRAAIDSADWFATVPRALDLPPEQFLFHLLTRSGRVTHRDVDARDPAVTSAVDRVVAALHGHAAGLLTPLPRSVPLRLGVVTLPNRVVAAPAAPDTAVDGAPGGDHAALVRSAGDDGVGLYLTEAVAVTPNGRVTPGSAGLWDDAQIASWRELTSLSRDRGMSLALRLSHAGRRGATRPRSGGLDRPLVEPWPLVAPSALPYTHRSPVPTPLDTAGLHEVASAFAGAARRAAAADVDVLLLDLADGYLLGSFLSPLTNQRDDEFGGDLEARSSWPLSVVEAVRGAWPADRPLGVRLTVDDRVAGGLGPADGVTLARALRDVGIDLVDVVAGFTVARGGGDYRRGWQVELSERVRQEAGVATIASGNLTTLDEVDTLVAAGRADLVVLDPYRYRREVVT